MAIGVILFRISDPINPWVRLVSILGQPLLPAAWRLVVAVINNELAQVFEGFLGSFGIPFFSFFKGIHW